MVVWCTQNLRRDGSSFMLHQPCQRCKYTTSGGYRLKTRYEKLVTHVESHVSAVRLVESGKSAISKAVIITVSVILVRMRLRAVPPKQRPRQAH